MSDAVIQVDHVWKKFRKGEVHDSLRELIPALFKRMTGHKPPKNELNKQEFWALRDVSFEVNRGESLGIIGPNGAGKSTMFKLLSRILRPNRGSYQIQGRLSALIEVGAGFHPDLTGRENIALNGTILGMSCKSIKDREEAIIDFAGISDFIDTPIKRYSSGMVARLGFSVAAHMEPDVLLVDEVLSVGDARFRDKCILHMHKLLKSNVTVIFVSHILDQVRQLCPKTLVLDHGSVVFHGNTDQAITKYLDLLAVSNEASKESEHHGIEIRQPVLCNAEGEPVLVWKARQPSSLEFDVVVTQPLDDYTILLNINTIGGTHIGTAASFREKFESPCKPGTYHVRFTLDPMILADGEYSLELKVNDMASGNCLWANGHPIVASVRGSGIVGPPITGDGTWEIVPCTSELAIATFRKPEVAIISHETR